MERVFPGICPLRIWGTVPLYVGTSKPYLPLGEIPLGVKLCEGFSESLNLRNMVRHVCKVAEEEIDLSAFDVYVPHPMGVGTNLGKVFHIVAIDIYSPETWNDHSHNPKQSP